VMDISEYIIHLHKNFGMSEGLQALENKAVTLHLACHSRAQNIGAKAAQMLRLIPSLTVQIIERCSGHGGTWGMMQTHFQTALKVGRPVVKQALTYANPLVLSECPLAAKHILQGMQIQATNSQSEAGLAYSTMHPIELLAKSYFG